MKINKSAYIIVVLVILYSSLSFAQERRRIQIDTSGFITKNEADFPGATIYISADTVFTDDVNKVLTELKHDITVVASGTARLDIGKPLLMTLDDIIKFIEISPKKVIANHLEALNHCPTTRKQLKEVLIEKELINKVFVPNDGDVINF